MNTRDLPALVLLADEMKFYWSVLHTAVRLDRSWHSNLEPQYLQAEQDALKIGRQMAGETRNIATLADLRVLSAELIEDAFMRIPDLAGTKSGDDSQLAFIRGVLADVEETGNLLFQGVDIGTCRCTEAQGARRRLVSRLGLHADVALRLDAADELVALTCTEAERLLGSCLAACRSAGQPAAYGEQVH